MFTENRIVEEGLAVYGPGATLPDIPEPGESLRVAILEQRRHGCATFPVLAELDAPRLWLVPAEDGEYVVTRFARLDQMPIEVRPRVWAALALRDALESALADRRSAAQLKWLATAGLLDLCGWTGAAVAEDLGYSAEAAVYKAAAKGRVLWAALNAWPWACLPPGAPGQGWGEGPLVRLAWNRWTNAG